MKIRIENITQASDSDWDRTWLSCDFATYFHSREWAEIWRYYSKGLIYPDAKTVTFSDGKKVLLPFSREKVFKDSIVNHLSSPALTFGGWIFEDAISSEHATALVKHFRKIPNLVWRTNPYDNTLSQIKVKGARKDDTQALPLRDGFEAIMQTWTKGHASAVTKAEREGVKIKQALTEDDWMAYFRVYEDSLKRWGDKATSRYGWELFSKMESLNSLNIRLWLAVFNEEVVAGALCFYSKRHVVYWHGASFEKYFNLRPSNLVVAKAIEDACKKGYRWFDFNPSGPHEGVRAFKKSFGAKSYASYYLVKRSLTSRIIGVLLKCYQLAGK